MKERMSTLFIGFVIGFLVTMIEIPMPESNWAKFIIGVVVLFVGSKIFRHITK